jgi:NAD(P)-dependent dehydrogenase (short-subunit alcohol dehydrogenase family)
VAALHRASAPAIDYARLGSIADAAAALRSDGPFHLVLVATGVLHGPDMLPEKRLAELDGAALETLFRSNAIGPALVLRHFAPLLDRQRSLLGVLSAKVGSIGDNRLGGWYGYRASKAALNMMLKTAAIELRRSHPGAVLAALHPGTVRSALSRPFRGEEIGREPVQAAAELLAVLDGLQAEDSGTFVAFSGERLPW